MVNYTGAFSQSESGKYFEWIMITNPGWRTIVHFNSAIKRRRIFSFQIMSIVSDHPVWQRTRRGHHGGAWRDYMRDTNSLCTSPRGPGTAPFQCSKCDDDPPSEEDSPMMTSDYCSCSSQSSSEDENFNTSFNMQGIQINIPEFKLAGPYPYSTPFPKFC